MRLPVIIGPTAVGKTRLAIQIASKVDAEIVSADSRQVYRLMDIGTAKPPREQLEAVRHYMINVVDPDEHFGAGQYGSGARDAVDTITSRGKIPLVVGGSGLYLRALVVGLFPAPPVNRSLRKRILDVAKERGTRFLYERLKEVDAKAAERIHPNDLQRISRALEVYEQTRTPISRLQKDTEVGDLQPLYIGLARGRRQLYDRIEKRVETMVQLGFVEEVARLLEMGYSPSLNSFRAVGYREMAAHLSGEMALDEAIVRTKRNTKALARRQLTWFRSLGGVKWVELSTRDEARAVDLISALIQESRDEPDTPWCGAFN